MELLALGTLPPNDAMRLRVHAATCDDCRARLLSAEAALGALALTSPFVSAPLELKDAVLAAVEADEPTPPVPLPGIDSVIRPSVRPLRSRLFFRRRLSTRFRLIATAVVAVPVTGLLVWVAVLQSQVNDLRAENTENQRRSEALVMIAMPSSIKSDLLPTSNNRGELGVATWSPERGRCIVLFDRLAKLEPGSAYRLWYTVEVEGQLRVFDAGEVKPDELGRADVEIDASRWRGRSYDLFLKIEQSPNDFDAESILSGTLYRW